MEGKKSTIIVVAIVVVIMVIAAIGYFFVFDKASKGITAMEGREIADNVAKEWNTSAKLVSVSNLRIIISEGKCEGWGYTYFNNAQYPLLRGLSVGVFENGTYYSAEKTQYPSIYVITNWTIDSDEAVIIAKDNQEIKRYLSRYDNRIRTVKLSAYGWLIRWSDYVGENPYNAEISIDATTGEVLSVEADY